MTKQTKTANTPAFVAYHVPERENAPWTRIGAAWPHKDGAGYTLDFELMPVTGGRVVLRKFEAKPEAAEEGEAA
jgi:hypothetical protein